jgi:hypothetical protein
LLQYRLNQPLHPPFKLRAGSLNRLQGTPKRAPFINITDHGLPGDNVQWLQLAMHTYCQTKQTSRPHRSDAWKALCAAVNGARSRGSHKRCWTYQYRWSLSGARKKTGGTAVQIQVDPHLRSSCRDRTMSRLTNSIVLQQRCKYTHGREGSA